MMKRIAWLLTASLLGYTNYQAYFDRNPEAPKQRRPDGSVYAENEIVPFTIQDPYLEFAFDETANEIVGFRLGYGESMGILSGRIETLTGNVNVDIIDQGEGLGNANSGGNLFDQIIVLLTPLLAGGSPLEARAQLVRGADGAPNIGSLDLVRPVVPLSRSRPATWTGWKTSARPT